MYIHGWRYTTWRVGGLAVERRRTERVFSVYRGIFRERKEDIFFSWMDFSLKSVTSVSYPLSGWRRATKSFVPRETFSIYIYIYICMYIHMRISYTLFVQHAS